jgi:hypothetical protein
LAARRPARGRSRRSASRTISWRAKAFRIDVAPYTAFVAIRQTLKNEFPLAAKIETPDTDKDAPRSRSSRRRRLCRRRGKDISRPLQRLHLVGVNGAVGDGFRRCLVRRISQEG